MSQQNLFSFLDFLDGFTAKIKLKHFIFKPDLKVKPYGKRFIEPHCLDIFVQVKRRLRDAFVIGLSLVTNASVPRLQFVNDSFVINFQLLLHDCSSI